MTPHCKASILIGFLFLVCSRSGKAQNETFYTNNSEPKGFVQWWEPKVANALLLKENPALPHLLNCITAPSSLSLSPYKNALLLQGHSKQIEGLKRYDEGRSRQRLSFQAIGETKLKEIGTLRGAASYGRDRRTDLQLSYLLNPDDYSPYLVSDTISNGSQNGEFYHIEGQFGRQWERLFYGWGGAYTGYVNKRLSNPKLSNYLSQLSLNLGLAIASKKHIFALKLATDFDQQSISAIDEKNMSVHFFPFIGFEMWNKKETMGGSGYQRKMSLQSYGGHFSFLNRESRRGGWQYLLDAAYFYKIMASKELSNKELFGYKRAEWDVRAMLVKPWRCWTFSSELNLNGYSLIGIENVYDHQFVSDDLGIRDYVKVGSSSLYKRRIYAEEWKLKVELEPNKAQKISVLWGLRHKAYRERYLSPSREIRQSYYQPYFGVGWRLHSSNSEIRCRLLASQRLPSDGSIYVPAHPSRLLHQLVYIPYFLRSAKEKSFSGRFSYTYSLKYQRAVGFSLTVAYSSSERLDPSRFPTSLLEASNSNKYACISALYFLF